LIHFENSDKEEVNTCLAQRGCISQLTDGRLRCKSDGCEGVMSLISVTHHGSVGIYEYECSTTIGKPKSKCHHTEKWHSQHPLDGDYALNKLLYAAEFLTGGSHTQMNQRADLLQMSHMPNDTYCKEIKKLAAICEKVID
jgi:hypothetical protein